MISARLLRIYRDTAYCACGVVMRIGHRGAVPAELGARAAVFITAWNPLSHRMPPGWNRRMQQRLDERLRRYRALPASGSLRHWHEEHLLVLADARPMLRLARLFRQRAVVVVRRRQAPRLVLR